jgi:hypothetical protein
MFMAVGRLRASQVDQVGFRRPIQDLASGLNRLGVVQSRFQALFHTGLPDAFDRIAFGWHAFLFLVFTGSMPLFLLSDKFCLSNYSK